MKVWLGEHISPQLASWITAKFGVEAVAVSDLGLARAKDRQVYDAARKADATVLTKDADFVGILERLGPPPRIILLTCGNTSNANLKRLLLHGMTLALEELARGEPFVEIG